MVYYPRLIHIIDDLKINITDNNVLLTNRRPLIYNKTRDNGAIILSITP